MVEPGFDALTAAVSPTSTLWRRRCQIQRSRPPGAEGFRAQRRWVQQAWKAPEKGRVEHVIPALKPRIDN